MTIKPAPTLQRETRVQKVLKAMLLRVYETGAWQVETDEAGSAYLSTVCGFAVEDSAPDADTMRAADVLLQLIAQGGGGEEDVVGLTYRETLESILVYFDACCWSDLEACAFLQAAYDVAGDNHRYPRPLTALTPPSAN